MKEDHLHKIVADEVPFGITLATAVAAKLNLGTSLRYAHRDYCGMGILYCEGFYYYGEVWDGYLEPSLSFESDKAFIDWLTMQSPASLRRQNDGDFYCGNQVITRQTLQVFIQQTPSFPDGCFFLYQQLKGKG